MLFRSVAAMASVHCAAATENFLVLENHSVDVPWWNQLVTGLPDPIIQDGHIAVPDKPGLGVEIDPEVCAAHPYRKNSFPSLWDDGWLKDFTQNDSRG